MALNLAPILLTAALTAAVATAATTLPATRPASKSEVDTAPAAAALTRGIDGEQPLPKTAAAAARLLPDNWQAADRLNAMAAKGADGEAAREAFRSIRTDLQFKPIMEAPLPKDFPPPTPVGEVEVKSYPAYRMAKATGKGKTPDGRFMTLFQHIQSKDIPMSTPVESTYATTKPSGEESGEGSTMAFIYPDEQTGRPGKAGGVTVMDVKPQQVLSVGERGRNTAESVDSARQTLQAWLTAHPTVKADGGLRVMSYNSPMVPDAKAYYEVQMPVKTGE